MAADGATSNGVSLLHTMPIVMKLVLVILCRGQLGGAACFRA